MQDCSGVDARQENDQCSLNSPGDSVSLLVATVDLKMERKGREH